MSILKLINEIQKNGIKLSFDNGTLRCLAPNGVIPSKIHDEIKNNKNDIIDFLTEATNEKSTITKRPDSLNNKSPLSFSQQRLWFLDQLIPNNSLYNIHLAVRLNGPLNIAALHKTFNTVAARHESLRTVFVNDEGKPKQVINAVKNLALPIIDVSALNKGDVENYKYELVKTESRITFDLSSGPLFRTTLLRLNHDHHVVLLSMHHIISDGWSMGVLTRELAILYTAFSQNAPNPLPPLVIQYADFAYWQRERLQGEMLEQQLSYWNQQLKGASQLLELPTDRPRPSAQGYRGATLQIQLPSLLSQRLNELSIQQGATLFMTLMTTLHILLSKLSGQSDVCVGTPIANRHISEVEPLIGFFANTLVIRTNTDGNPAFTDLLSQTRQTILDGYSHQDLPFEQLIDRLNVERDMSYSPLFQVLFALQNEPKPVLKEAELQLQNIETPNSIVRFDLELYLIETPDGINVTWQYDRDLFNVQTIKRWIELFHQLLEKIVSTPQARLSELTPLDDQQRQLILTQWNDTAVSYSATSSLHELFEAQVNRTPDAVAVVCEDQYLTYAQLNERANQLAYYLHHRGARRDTLVGVCAERSLEMIIALLGILKAGAAYLPLDPDYPKARLRFILEDTQVALLLTQHHLLDVLPKVDLEPICLDHHWQQIAEVDAISLPRIVTDNLAYVIYTSGSTGHPKGVGISHAGINNRLLWMQDHFQLLPHERVLQKTPFSFDVSGWEFFWPLITGARLIMAKPEGHKDPVYLSHIIDQHQITTVHFVPSMLQVFLEQLPSGSGASLQRLICSGEALTPELQQRCQAQLNAQIHNLYGPTEASIDVTAWACVAEPALYRVPIGKPIANTETYVLDRYLNPTPVGVPGELYLGGLGLGRGYFNRVALTAQSFIPHPFSHQGKRLYKTGDQVRYLADGNIEYLGRIDHQVKLRGLRIELGEIEAALCQHPAVSETAVLLREDKPGQKRLAAYLLWRDQQEVVEIHALKIFLQNQLPDYMVPSNYTTLTAMPLTPSGKLDRKALPAPEVMNTHQDFVEPRTPTEEMLAAIWKDVLKLEKIGAHDNFFELGGHSLLATQLVSRVRKYFAVELQIRELFTHPILHALAKQIDSGLQANNGVVIPPITVISRDTDLLLSFAQQRLWFIDQMNPNNSLYNVPAFMRLFGPLAIPTLFQTFNLVIQRHETLRTVFTSVAGQPRQVIKPQSTIMLPVIDLSGLPDAVSEANITSLATAEAQRGFTLSEGPLLRTTLLYLGREHHVILVTMHHIVSDGWSMGILIEELASLYSALSQGLPSPLSPLSIQYADFAHWQRDWLQGQALDQQLGYWREQLKGAPELLELPIDHQRPPVQNNRGNTKHFKLEKSLSTKIKKLSYEQGASVFMTLMAALHILLSKLSGQQDICVGTPIANRHYQEVEPLIGFFINTLVIRSRLSGHQTFNQLLMDVRDRTLSAYAHQDFPFEQLVDELNVPRDMRHTPLYQVSFSFHNMPRPSLQASQIQLSPIATPVSTVKSEIELHVTESPDGFSGHWGYAIDLFDGATIARWSDSFLHLLEQIVAQPEAPLSDLSLLTQEQQRQIVAQWNNTSKPYPSQSCIHQLFEAQAARNPHAEALVIEELSMSYGELNTRANQLAHYLRGQGIKPDTLIGLYIGRSLDALVAILGILKAGSAYVPLDPDSPQERLISTLKDARVLTLITNSDLAQNLPDLPTRVLSQLSYRELILDTQWNKISSCPSDNPVNINVPGNLAYVIYTSGSTGRPKGVQIQHGSLCNLVHAQINSFNHSEVTRYLQFSSLSFDASVSDIFCTLISGGTLCVASQVQRHSMDEALRWMKYQNVNAATFPPSVLSAVGSSQELPKLRTLIVAGEACPASLVKQWAPHCQFFNAYGPTEATVCASLTSCSDTEQAPSIGYPIDNVSIYLLDRHLDPVPIGVVGELYVGGAGLARGYLNKFQLTAEKFLPDPFSTTPGARMYRTGDLARYLADGQIDYKGRVDHQIKLRGFRVELGEIEAILRSHPTVREAVILPSEDGLGKKQLAAYLVAEPDLVLAEPLELRAFIQKYLPTHMVPNTFTTIDHIPVTINGKLDRKQLLALKTTDAKKEFVAPRNPTEQTIANIIMEVLKVENVGVYDNFFELGGHSLLATQVISKIQDQLQVKLNVGILFESPTIEKVATFIQTVEQAKLDSTMFNDTPKEHDYQEVEL